MKIVTEFFKDEAYAGKPKEIAKYALWATRGNGPAIFGIPTPRTCTAARGEDDYIVSSHPGPPHFFFSQYMIYLFRNPKTFSNRSLLSNYLLHFSNGAKDRAMITAVLLARSHWQLLG